MRVIGGSLRGRRFNPPQNIPTRPTTDIAKEGLFNFIGNYFNFDNIKVLDLFAGTGSISYEFSSRGCEDITSVEIFPKCARFIKETSAKFEIEGLKLVQGDVFDYIKNSSTQFDVIFAGPPYPLKTLDTLPDLIFDHDLVEGAGWFILEHNPNHDFTDHPMFQEARNYGSTIFSIFSSQSF